MKSDTPNTRARSLCVVLLSGGIDSAACVRFYLQQHFSIRGLFVNYGQTSAVPEKRAAKAVAAYYRIPLAVVTWYGLEQKRSGAIKGRNAFLLFGGLMEIPGNVRVLAIGVHAGTNYADCSPIFVRKVQSVLDLYTAGRLQLGTPFLKWTKRDIWAYAKTNNVPLHLTYSCERGVKQPCGACPSCRDLEILHACS